MKTTILSTFCLLLLTFAMNAQVIIEGKVTDAKTGEAIPFVTIGELGQTKGTSSNIDGEFTLSVSSIPVELFFSHVGFDRKSETFNATSGLDVKLTASSNILNDVVIAGKKESGFEAGLIKKAIKRTLSTSIKDSYGKALYRQTSRNGDEYSELFEIFYDTRFNGDGLQSWAVQEGRYAMKDAAENPNFLFNKNFTYFLRLFPVLQPPTDDFMTPMREDVETYYDLKVNGAVKLGDRELIELEFSLKEEIFTPAMTGTMWLDSKTFNVIKIKSEIVSDDLSIIKLTEKGRSWKNYRISAEIAFLTDDLEMPKLDYIKLNQSLDYYDGEALLQPVKTSALLSFYEYYQPVKNKRLGGKLYRRSGDREVLDDLGYNAEFWKINPMVKRTPIENNIIASFEENSAFGSIYLNDKDQIQLDKDELRNDATMKFVQSQFYKNRLTRQKLHLHLDKPFYLPGEKVRLAAYLSKAADLKPDPRSGVVAIDLVGAENKVIKRYRVGLFSGQGAGAIDLPADLAPGGYFLRSYSPWMLNFDEKYLHYQPIKILDVNQKSRRGVALSDGSSINQVDLGMMAYDVETVQETITYAESGVLLAGTANQIYIEDAKGTANRSGKILDRDRKKQAEFATDEAGMASAFMMAQPGESYKLQWDDDSKTFALPEVTNSGMKMQVNNRKANEMSIRVLATPDFNDKRFYLVVRGHDQILHREMAQIKRNFAVIKLSKNKFPEGIVQLSIMDQDRQVYAQRLAFIYHNRPMEVLARPSFSRTKRGPNSVLLQIVDSDGKPQPGRYSIGIVDAEKISSFERTSIASNLWLNSEFFRQFPYAQLVDHEPSEEVLASLDLWLSGQKLSQYQWPEVFANNRRKAEIAPMAALVMQGKVKAAVGNKGLANRKINLVPLDGLGQVDETTSDEEGNFTFKNLQMFDQGEFFLQANKENNKVSTAKFDVSWPLPEAKGTVQVIEGEIIENDRTQAYLAYANRKQKLDSMYNFSDDIMLDEITIKGRLQPQDGPRSWHRSEDADATLKIDESMHGITSIFDLLAHRVGSVTVRKGQGDNLPGQGDFLSIRGNAVPPLVLLDGVAIYHPVSSTYGTVDMRAALAMGISIPDLDRIEVLREVSQTTVYGLEAFGGVIAIFTKDGGRAVSQTLGVLKAEGFASGIFFGGPDYNVDDPEHLKPDLRTTLYWDGVMQLDANGVYEAKFFSSDQSKQYLIVVEGISDNGQVISWVKKLPE